MLSAMNDRTLNMTEGKPFRLILSFAFPLMLGNVFQQFYTVVDTAVVGKALGVSGLAAMGAADWLNWLMLSIVQGLTQGFGILMAQAFGARQTDRLRASVGASVLLAVGASLLLVLLGQLVALPVLKLLRTPGDILPGSVLYLRVMFGGLPIVMAYNLCACILRSLGDGKTPLHAMVIASFVNIGLDLLFVLVFRWGIGGAAAATLIAQCCAAGICLVQLKGLPQLRLSHQDLHPPVQLLTKLLSLGSPMAFQNAVIAIGGMIVQMVVNGFGVVFIAGITATNKLYGILEIAALSYGYAMITYIGQNQGAGHDSRVRQGAKTALGISLVTSAIIAAVMLLFGKWIVGCFLSGTPQEVSAATEIAYRYLATMSLCLPILYVLHVYRSCLQGLGNTVLPMVSGIGEFVMRTGAALTLPLLLGQEGIYFAEVLAWLGADLILVPSWFLVLRQHKKRL